MNQEVLGDRIEVIAPDVLERLIETTCSKRRTGYLGDANLGIEKIRLLLRLAYDLQVIDQRRYPFASQCVYGG